MREILRTPRLVLRRLEAADVRRLVELDSDPEVMRYLSGGVPTPRAVIETEVLPRFLSYDAGPPGLGFFAAERRADGAFLGWFHLRPAQHGGEGELEIGYRLRREAWNRGYATEGSRALVRLAFVELGAQRVVAYTLAVNLASRRVMEKAGLSLEATFVQPELSHIPGWEQGSVRYALERSAWQATLDSAAARGDEAQETAARRQDEAPALPGPRGPSGGER